MTTTRGRKLEPRTDAERIQLLVDLIGYGQARRDISIGFDLGSGALQLYAGDSGKFENLVVEDPTGDVRALLDRAISKKVAATPRKKRRSRS